MGTIAACLCWVRNFRLVGEGGRDRLTDRQTDRQTDTDSVVSLSLLSAMGSVLHLTFMS